MKEFSNKPITRRDFLKLSIRIGVPATVAILIGSIQGSEILWQLERLFCTPEKYDTAIFFIKPLDEQEDQWMIASGLLVDPHNILTAAHIGINNNFLYTSEREIGKTCTEGRAVEGNIVETIPHPSLDLAIVYLDKPEFKPDFNEIRRNPISRGDGPLTLSSLAHLEREEICAGYVSQITDTDQFGQIKLQNSILILDNSVAAMGNSGAPLFLDETRELVGLCIGGNKSETLGLSPRSFFVNLTSPEVLSWIQANTKS